MLHLLFFHNVLSPASVNASSRIFHAPDYRQRHTFQNGKNTLITAHSPQHKKDTIVICGAEIPMLRKYPILGYLRKQMIFDFGIRIGY